MSTYTVPDCPADPEQAALELIVRLPCDMLGQGGPGLREILQDYTSLLHVAGCFTGLSWPDAKAVAAAAAFDVCMRDDPAGFLRFRADNAATGADGQQWDDQEAVARALRIAAQPLE